MRIRGGLGDVDGDLHWIIDLISLTFRKSLAKYRFFGFHIRHLAPPSSQTPFWGVTFLFFKVIGAKINLGEDIRRRPSRRLLRESVEEAAVAS